MNLARKPSVAWLCPTYKRADKHEQLASVFASQDYSGPLLLLVLDDSPEGPSPLFSKVLDRRVVYRYVSGPRMSIGAKRNMLCAMARERGVEICVHADDDDLLAPSYTTVMVDALAGHDLAKLSVFNIFREVDGTSWQWDTRTVEGVSCIVSGSDPVVCSDAPRDPESRDFALYGYGFSLVYKTSLFRCVQFPDMDRGEDYAFVRSALDKGANLNLVADRPEIVWHFVHPSSTSRSFPQKRLDGPMPPLTKVETPKHVELRPNRIYKIVAMVKNEHTLAEMTMRASAYGLVVVDVEDDVKMEAEPPKDYRFVRATLRATRASKMRSKVPAPLSWIDNTHIKSIGVAGLPQIAQLSPGLGHRPTQQDCPTCRNYAWDRGLMGGTVNAIDGSPHHPSCPRLAGLAPTKMERRIQRLQARRGLPVTGTLGAR